MKCIIIAIGTEVVSGDIVNTDASYIANYIKKFGIETIRHVAVLDSKKAIIKVVKQSLEKAELVITTGGLGPTYDDITKIAIAKAVKLPLEKDEDSLDAIKAFFQKLGRDMTPNNERQSYFPKNSIIVPNDNGTAPACITNCSKGTVIMLPGPPNEMIPLIQSKLVTEYFNSVKTEEICEVILHFFGIGESSLEELLKDYMNKSKGLILAPYAKTGEVELKITAKAKTAEEACKKADDLKKKIYELAGEYIYGEGHVNLQKAMIRKLKEKGKKLITVESCTGGIIAGKITEIPGSSEVFLGGLVTYSNELKVMLADVKEATLKEFGAVSKGTACEMAEGARLKYNADVAVSVTGIAGPGGDTEDKPVGLVYIGISTADETTATRFNFVGNRAKIRELSMKNALYMVYDELNK